MRCPRLPLRNNSACLLRTVGGSSLAPQPGVDSWPDVRFNGVRSGFCGGPAFGSQSATNGVAERGVQSVQCHVRVLRNATEAALGVEPPVGHAIWPWPVEHAAVLLNQGRGRARWEDVIREAHCVKRGKIPGLVFAEKVMWKRKPAEEALNKLTRM